LLVILWNTFMMHGPLNVKLKEALICISILLILLIFLEYLYFLLKIWRLNIMVSGYSVI